MTDIILRPPTRHQIRAAKISSHIALEPPEQISFQHTVLCQTSMPYRNQGDNIREWERVQGNVYLRIEAGAAKHPGQNQWVKLGLPYGSKPRLVLMHLNAEALKQGTPLIEVEDSFTAFIRRIQDPLKLGKSGPNGEEFRAFKDQLTRLAVATVRLALSTEVRSFQVNSHIIDAFDLWLVKDERQRVFWPSIVRMNDRYFESLQKHAVPLDERALAALSNSPVALDLYAWLAQRLHRVSKKQFITWVSLKEQFGQGYSRMDNFKRMFRHNLMMVYLQYNAARVEEDDNGLTLYRSPPPIRKLLKRL